MRLSTSERNKAGKAIHPFTTGLQHDIPLGAIFSAIEQTTSFYVADEDGEPWSGFLCGEEGGCTFSLAHKERRVPCDNSVLYFTWYKVGQRWDVVAYLS